jgi:sugar lactone lactonase YvrE
MQGTESHEVEVVMESADDLGSAPVWDMETSSLWWLDILGCRLHRLQIVDNTHDIFPMPELIGCFALTGDDRLVLGAIKGFAYFNPKSEEFTLIEDSVPDGLRLNDGKVDPAGRFWAGIVNRKPGKIPNGSLYVLDTDGKVRRFLDDLEGFNGPAWSPDGTVMYFTDTPTHRIDRVEFDPDRGLLGPREPFIDIPDLTPDGFTVDEEGCLWVSLFSSGRIGRFSPSGEHLTDVPLPTDNPTGCAFGGPDRGSLYITTARVRGSRSGVDHGPLLGPPAGALLRVDVGVRGLPVPRYGVAA